MYPVPLDDIVRCIGYKVDFFEVTIENEHISGAVYYNDKQIWLNPNDIIKRRNFTLAHELGHILLWHEKDSQNGNNTPITGDIKLDFYLVLFIISTIGLFSTIAINNKKENLEER